MRRRVEQATLQRIVQGLWGYVTSLAALRKQLEHYMTTRKRSFQAEVSRKQARMFRVTAFLDDVEAEAA